MMSEAWFKRMGQQAWPVALAKNLGVKPMRIGLHDVAFVLFRDQNNQPCVLLDVCPHRGAPLSLGTCSDGKLRCAYRGWLFDGEGRCHDIPGLAQRAITSQLTRSLYAFEHQGAIWISANEAKPHTQLTAWDFQRVVTLTASIQTSVQEAAENFLDPFHTHFVHRGWIRQQDASQRQRIKVNVSPVTNISNLVQGVEAVYEDGGQTGWISKLFEPKRTHSLGRFLLPAIAEVAYYDGDACTFAASAWLVPAQEGQLQVMAWVGAKSVFIPAWLQKTLMRRLFQKILIQDIEIVEACNTNRKRHPEFLPMSTKLDLLSSQIQALLRGNSVASFETEVLI